MSASHRRASAPVPHEVYTEEYFRTAEAGYEQWERTGGAKFGGFYWGAFGFRPPGKGERVLDVGTGRGELPILAAEQGAAIGVGIDYAAASMKLSRQTQAARGGPRGAYFLRASALQMPFPDAAFDVAYLMDFVEHLTAAELDAALQELLRVLRPGGEIVIHTMPNRLMYDVTYRALRGFSFLRGRPWPKEPRAQYELDMHVNEMRRGELRRTLKRAGFVSGRVWLGGFCWVDYVPSERARRLLTRMHNRPWLRALTSTDIWAIAGRP